MFHIIASFRKHGNGRVELEENKRLGIIRLRVKHDILDLDYDNMDYAIGLFDRYRG